jgi:hypothetical protein
MTDCAFKVLLYPQFHMFDQGLGPPFRCIRVLYPGLPATFFNRILRLASSGGLSDRCQKPRTWKDGWQLAVTLSIDVASPKV